MDSHRLTHRAGYAVLVVYGIAAVICVWAVALGVDAIVQHSVIGGICVIVIGALLLAGLGWRFSVKLQQLRSRS